MTLDSTLLARLREGDDLSARIEAADCLEDQARKIMELSEELAGFVGALTDYGRNRDNVLSIDHDGLCARIKLARSTLFATPPSSEPTP